MYIIIYFCIVKLIIELLFPYADMTNFEKQKLTEIVLYILNKANGLDYYHVFKIIYFAELEHLAKYGFRMTTDEFCALPDGPVPSLLYDCIKDNSFCDKDLENMINKNVEKGNDDAYYMLTAKRKADLDYLSEAEIESLDKSIRDNATMPYDKLKEKSHGKEWRRAFYESSGRKVMDTIGMATDGMASEEMIEYIKENLAVETALI